MELGDACDIEFLAHLEHEVEKLEIGSSSGEAKIKSIAG